jgi:hypothetical protein
MAEPRDALASALASYLTPEQVTKLIDEILSIEKRVSAEFDCKKCGQRQMRWTTVPDAKAVALALPDLLNQAYGRPGETNERTDPVVFKRLTRLTEEDEVAVRAK